MDWKHALATLTAQQRAQFEQILLTEGARFNVFPLSITQERRWVSERRVTGTTMHHIAAALRLDGRVDLRALQRSFEFLIDRYEILRTTFHQIAGQPRQAIAPVGSISLHLPIVDLHTLAADREEGEVLRLAAEEREKPFDLEEGPLLRVVVLALGPTRHVVLFTIHHLIFDGWSMGLFLRELTTVYSALVARQPVVLPPVLIHYADFAAWQRQIAQEVDQQAAFQSWRSRLGQADLLLYLPFKGLRPAQRAFHSATHPLRLPSDLVQKLRNIALEEQATLFMVLMAAFQVLLYRYTGQRRFVIGTYTANRQRPEIANLIGDCTDILPLVADFSGAGSTFRQFLRRVRDLVLEAQQFAPLPVHQVTHGLWPEVDRSQHALFPVMFNLFPAKSAAARQLPGLDVTPLDVPENQTAMPFDLQFCLWSGLDDHAGYIEYDTDLLTGELIADMARCLDSVVESIVQHTDQPLDTLALFSGKEHELIAPRDSAPLLHESAPQCISRLAGRFPDAIAIHDARGREWTYRELERAALRVACALRQDGLMAGQVVEVRGARSAELIAGLLGVLMASGACLVASEAGSRQAPAVPNQAFSLTQQQIAAWIADDQRGLPAHGLLPVDGEQLAWVLPGDSTDDHPMRLSHRTLSGVMEAYRQASAISGTDRCLHHASPDTPVALVEMFLPLLSGATLCLAPDGAHTSPELLHQLDISIAALPAPLLREPSWAEAMKPLGLIVTGDLRPLPPAAQERCAGRALYAADAAGMSFWPMAARLPQADRVIFQHGTHAFQAVVLDERMAPVPSGVVGALYIVGDGVPRSIGHRAATAPAFQAADWSVWSAAGAYDTGMLARMLPGGDIEFVGRREEWITRRGQRIWLGQLAQLLRTVEGVCDATVIQAPADRAVEPPLAAYGILWPGVNVAEVRERIKQCLARSLPAALRPATFVALPRWPLTSSGKIEWRALPAPQETDQLAYLSPARRGKHLSPAKQELLAKRLREIGSARSAGKGDGSV